MLFRFCLIISLFWGCQRNNEHVINNLSNTTDNNSKIKVRWLGQWYGEGKKELLIRQLAREFNLLHQDIEIDLEFPYQMAKIKPDADAFPYTIDTIKKMVVNNQWPYDIMLCDNFIYERVSKDLNYPDWGKKYLVNFINEPWYIKAHKDGFFKTDRYISVFGGIAPGDYIEGLLDALYVSSETENRLGIKIKRQGMNMDDFYSYATSVVEYNKTHEDKITFLWSPHDNDITHFFNQLVMSALGKDAPDSREEAVEALRQGYQSLEKLSHVNPLQIYTDLHESRKLYQDKILFIMYPSWISMFWEKSNPNGFKLMHPCELPSITDKHATSYSGFYNCTFVVPVNAKHRKEAEMFMQFIASEKTAGKWIKYSKCPSGLKNRISYNNFGTDEYTTFANYLAQRYNNNLDMVNLPVLLFKTSKNIDLKADQVLNGKVTANEALANVLHQVNK